MSAHLGATSSETLSPVVTIVSMISWSRRPLHVVVLGAASRALSSI